MSSVLNNKEIPGVAPIKRSRAENWLSQDKTLLKELVRERVHVIENKNTDSNSNKKKKDAWTDLHKTFNSICTGAQRTSNQLKTQWTVLKIQEKKEKAHYRREFLRTGGGPHPKEPDNQDADDISSWLPMEFEIDHNEYDSDSRAVPKTVLSSEKVVLASVEVVAAPVEYPTPLEISTPLEYPTPSGVGTSSGVDQLTVMCIIEDEDHVEEVLNVPNDTAVKTNVKIEKMNKIKRQRLKKKAIPFATTNATAAAKIAEFENKCRQERHELQMENERKRSRNLDLKYELLQAKLSYYKNMSH